MMTKWTFTLALSFGAALLAAQSAWRQLPGAPVNGRYDDIFFINRQTGWLAGGDGTIHKTSDGGATWKKQYGGGEYFRSIEFINEKTGFAGTLDGILLKTTDGGDTWIDIASGIQPKPAAICGISAPDDSTVYAVGQWDSPAFLLKSTDGGKTWISKNMNIYANALVDVLFVSKDTGYVAGKSELGGLILYTTNGGNTWKSVYNSFRAGDYVWKLQRVDAKVWVASVQTWTNAGRFVKSVDGGKTWTGKAAPIGHMQGIGFVTPEKGWCGGYDPGFYETTDGGASWKFKLLGGNYNRFFVFDSTFAYASGQSAYKYAPTAVSAPETPLTAAADSDFEWQLTPNPGSGHFEVTFKLKRADNIRFSVLSAAGIELERLSGGRWPAGEHRVALDANLPAGMYLLAVQRNHGLHTRPFVIVGRE